MIRVFADDLTGAAELAGICKEHALDTLLTVVPTAANHAEAVVYCTDSRSMDLAAALNITEQFLEPISIAKEEMVYKKTDSVLRGHVVEELLLQMKQLGYQRVLFIPENPSMGRIISKGQYFINGQLLSETAFAHDPEFPRKTADVVDMLAGHGADIQVLQCADELPEMGIIVGEASCIEDLEKWASKIDQDMMLAGGGDFFQAILQQRFGNPTPTLISPPQQPFLYISGTSFQASVSFIQSLAGENGIVHYIDADVLEGKSLQTWLGNCARALEENQKAVVAFHPSLQGQALYSALFLRKKMASIISALLSMTTIREIMIEGGSTAMAILDELNLPYWVPDAVFRRGVVRMQDAHQQYAITLKPGSYPLPGFITSLFPINHQ
jgi:uncharacterized protein YgbK (DUF1537 family)